MHNEELINSNKGRPQLLIGRIVCLVSLVLVFGLVNSTVARASEIVTFENLSGGSATGTIYLNQATSQWQTVGSGSTFDPDGAGPLPAIDLSGLTWVPQWNGVSTPTGGINVGNYWVNLNFVSFVTGGPVYNVYFVDQGAPPPNGNTVIYDYGTWTEQQNAGSVPDTGTTLLLLVMSLASLVAVGGRRRAGATT